MATPAPYIPGNTIAACVLNENGIDFLDRMSGLYCSPKALYVPCKVSDLKYDNEDRWAVPISDNGIFTGFDYSTLRQGNYAQTPPTVDSIPCFLIKETRHSKYWYIYGELTDLMAAANVANGSATVLMQGIVEVQDPFNSPRNIFAVDPAIFPKIIIPQYTISLLNGSSIPYAVFSLPTISGGAKYFPQGIFNNAYLPAASLSGYTTPANLLTFLNASWSSLGVNTVTWTLSSDNMTLFATGLTVGDRLGVVVTTV
jgi:hypothetical protein